MATTQAKILFYYWDHHENPDFAQIQKAINAVYNGKNAPIICGEVPTADWDQFTIAITSVPVPVEVIGEAFTRQNDNDTLDWDDTPTPIPEEIEFEIVTSHSATITRKRR